jgi:phosphatidate cytidylyltransferase
VATQQTGGARGRPRGRGHETQRREHDTSTVARVIVALPWAAFAVAIIVAGGTIFAAAVIAFGVVALTELYRMLAPARPIAVAGFAGVAGLVLAARFGDQFQMMLVLVCLVPVTFLLAIARPYRRHVTLAMAVTFFGVLWIGLALAHAVLLRELDHGGALVANTLIGTFLGDTGAYFGGRLWGSHRLAPRISPAKTVEGLIAGIVVGTFAFWFAGLYQNWLSGIDALVIGACVAVAAPMGDLFESLVKRDLGVKDAGRLFGEHGGVLDRLDAAFFSIVVAYYAASALL